MDHPRGSHGADATICTQVASGDEDLETLADEIVARHGNPDAPGPRRSRRNKVNKRERRGLPRGFDHRA